MFTIWAPKIYLFQNRQRPSRFARAHPLKERGGPSAQRQGQIQKHLHHNEGKEAPGGRRISALQPKKPGTARSPSPDGGPSNQPKEHKERNKAIEPPPAIPTRSSGKLSTTINTCFALRPLSISLSHNKKTIPHETAKPNGSTPNLPQHENRKKEEKNTFQRATATNPFASISCVAKICSRRSPLTIFLWQDRQPYSLLPWPFSKGYAVSLAEMPP